MLELQAEQTVTVKKPLVADSSEFTLAAWIKPAAVPDSDAPLVDGGGVTLHLQAGYPQVRCGKQKPAAGPQTDPASGGCSACRVDPQAASWSHLAVVYSAPAGRCTTT